MLIYHSIKQSLPKKRDCVGCLDAAIPPRVWSFQWLACTSQRVLVDLRGNRVAVIRFWNSFFGNSCCMQFLFPSFQTCLVRFKLESGLMDSTTPSQGFHFTCTSFLESCYVSLAFPTQTALRTYWAPTYRSCHQNINVSPALCGDTGGTRNQCRKSLGVGHWTTMNLKMIIWPIVLCFWGCKGWPNHWKLLKISHLFVMFQHGKATLSQNKKNVMKL